MAKSKITLGQVEPLAQAVNWAMQQADSYGTRFKLREVLRSLATHGADFETERMRLIDEYAEKGEDGKPLLGEGDAVLFGENQATVDRRWQELRSTEVTISHKLTLDDVADLPADPALDALELLLG